VISVENAAALIFGNLQCTNMRDVMDSLPKEEVVGLLADWRRLIAENQAVEKIINSVATHPKLAVAWHEKGNASQHYHAKIFQLIIDNTVSA
jgi:hypothetical protein